MQVLAEGDRTTKHDPPDDQDESNSDQGFHDSPRMLTAILDDRVPAMKPTRRATRWQRAADACSPGEKVRPPPGGEAGARDPVGDGEGGDVTGSRSSCWFSSRASARSRCRGGWAVVAKRHPLIGVGLRLALDVAVTGLRPEQDLLLLVVEHELALVGLHREDSMAFAL